MGGLAKKIPFTYWMMVIGTLALTGVGIPHFIGFAGFHSKDAIIEAAYAAHTPNNYVFWTLVARRLHDLVLFVAAGVHDLPPDAALGATHAAHHATARRMHDHKTIDTHKDDHGHGHTRAAREPAGDADPARLCWRSARCSPASLFTQVLHRHDDVAGAADPYKAFWGKSIFEGAEQPHPARACTRSPVGSAGRRSSRWRRVSALAYLYYIRAPWLPAATARAFAPLYKFFLNKWYFDELYDLIFVRPANAIGRFFWKGGDGGVIDRTIDGTANSSAG